LPTRIKEFELKDVSINGWKVLIFIGNPFITDDYEVNGNIITLPISKFIEENYKHKLLFHTPVHPTNVLIQHVCHTLIDVLNIENTMDYWTDHLSSFVRNIMYKCVEQVVSFNTPAPLIELNYEYHHNVKDITEWYYKNYAQLDQSHFL
jgi:hypothetical protein